MRKCLIIAIIFIHSSPTFRGSNEIGQMNITINKCKCFDIVENPLHVGNASSLESIAITKDLVSSFVMHCQAFIAAIFSWCLIVGLYAFSTTGSHHTALFVCKTHHVLWMMLYALDRDLFQAFSILFFTSCHSGTG